eukprot:g9048.t1
MLSSPGSEGSSGAKTDNPKGIVNNKAPRPTAKAIQKYVEIARLKEENKALRERLAALSQDKSPGHKTIEESYIFLQGKNSKPRWPDFTSSVRVLKEHDNIADSTQSSTKSNSEGKGVKFIAKYCVIKSNDNKITLRKVVEKHTVYDLILQKKKGVQAKSITTKQKVINTEEPCKVAKFNINNYIDKKDKWLLEDTQWISIRTEHKTFIVGNIYLRPKQNVAHMKSQHRTLLSAVNGINKETKYEVILMGDFNFQVSQSKFDISQFSLDYNQSGPVTSEMIRDVPLPHVGKAETSHEGIGWSS